MEAKRHKSLVAYFDCYAFSSLSETIPPGYLIKILLRLESKLKKLVSPEMQLYVFSDSGLLLYTIPPDALAQEIDFTREAVRKFTTTLQQIYNLYLDFGLLLRGAISFGTVTVKHTFFLGTPIIEAVRLEHKGLAPLILFPAKILTELAGPTFGMRVDVQMKDNTIITALPVIPSPSHWAAYKAQIEKMRKEACYLMLQHSAEIDTSLKIVKSILGKMKKSGSYQPSQERRYAH